MTYDFDTIAQRHNTDCVKYDALRQFFGHDDLTPLWVADMDFDVAEPIHRALCRRMDHHVYGYNATPDRFWTSITDWLKRRHSLTVGRDELTYVPGIVRGIGLAINHYTRPGDKILIQPPVYHPFANLTRGNGRVVVENPLLFDGTTYTMDLAGLEDAMRREQPRLMILCNPHNPGGIQWDEATLRHVARLARENGVIVISDEIHSDLMLWGTRHVPFLSVSDDARQVGIMFGAPSKTFNIPGLVSSWCVIPNAELRKDFYNWMEVNEFCIPTMVACEGTVAAYNEGEEWLGQVLQYIEGNINAVERYIDDNLPGVRAIRPQASFLVWLDCRGLRLAHDELISLFIDKAHLALNDGAMFGHGGDGFMRLNVATSRHTLIKALDALKSAI